MYTHVLVYHIKYLPHHSVTTYSQIVGSSGSPSDGFNPGDQLQQGNNGMPPPPFAPTPGTPQGIILTAEQWMATQATLQRLETHLNDPDRSRSRSYHPRCCSHSRDSRRHADDDFVMRQTMLKPKMPNVYKGTSHKELYIFLWQCLKHSMLWTPSLIILVQVFLLLFFFAVGPAIKDVYPVAMLWPTRNSKRCSATTKETKKSLSIKPRGKNRYIPSRFHSSRSAPSLRSMTLSIRHLNQWWSAVRHNLRPREQLYNTGKRIGSYTTLSTV